MTTKNRRADALTEEQFEDRLLPLLIKHLDSKARHYLTREQVRDGIEVTRVTTYAMNLARAILDEFPIRQPTAAPLPMLLFCPRCGTQHIDRPEVEPGRLISGGPFAGRAVAPRVTWNNPPHRSHLCHACGIVWRPADVATVGVQSIETHGKADTWSADMPWTGYNRAALSQAAAPAEPRELPTMRNAFRVTEVSGDPDPAKRRFYMRFSFPSIEALHAADDEWRKFLAAAQAGAQDEDAYVAKRLSEALASVYATIVGDDRVDESDGLNAIQRVEKAAQVLRLEVDLYRAQAKPEKADARVGLTDALRRAREELSIVEWENDPPSRVVKLFDEIDALLQGANHAE